MDSLVVIYLAAGQSKRMGMNKLELPLGESTIGSQVLELVIKENLGHVLVVTKANDELNWLHPSLFQQPFKDRWTNVTCRDADKGQAHSLQCGLSAAMDRNPKGMMILLADQPFLSLQTIQHLAGKFTEASQTDEKTDFVAASFQGIPRPPIIFSPKVLPLLFQLKGDIGARKLLQSRQLTGQWIEYENKREFFDIDSMEEYQQVKGAVTSEAKSGGCSI